jgi:hypothetical protein
MAVPLTPFSDWTHAVEWGRIAEEARKSVPLKILWEELRESQKVSVEYSGFWKQFKKRFPLMPVHDCSLWI